MPEWVAGLYERAKGPDPTVEAELVTALGERRAQGDAAGVAWACLALARVAFVVRDTGRGIPPRVLEELFDTFRRRASGEDFAVSRAGLGLAICQKLLAAMGSELAVESTEGVGTTFSFELELPRSDR